MVRFDAEAIALSKAFQPFEEAQLAELDREMGHIVGEVERFKHAALFLFLVMVPICTVLVYLVQRTIRRSSASILEVVKRMVRGDVRGRVALTDKGGAFAEVGQHINTLGDNLVETSRAINLQAGSVTAFAKGILNLRSVLQNDANALQGVAAELEGVSQTLDQGVEAVQGELSEAVQHMVTVHGSAQELFDSVVSINASAGEADSSVTAMTQASQVLVSSVTEVDQSLLRVSDGVIKSSEAATSLENSLGEVRARCREASDASGQADQRVKGALEAMEKLDGNVQEVGKIVELINDVAEQTNMLALNAGAGDSGKGFAVVANEVKSLASKTAEAAHSIATQIESIQDETRDASGMVQEITDIVGEINQANSEIVQSVDAQGYLVEEMAEAMSQMAEASTTVSAETQAMGESTRQVEQAAEVTAQGVGAIVQSAASLSNLAEVMTRKSEESRKGVETTLGEMGKSTFAAKTAHSKSAASRKVVDSLNSSVDQFNALAEVGCQISDALYAAQSSLDIGPEPFPARRMKEIHLKLLGQMVDVANGVKQMGLDEVTTAANCELGRWLRDVGDRQYVGVPLYQDMKETHDRVHETAAEIVRLANDGKQEAAKVTLESFQDLRRTLFERMNLLYMGQRDEREFFQNQKMLWTEEMSVGLPHMDKDHQDLLDIINKLSAELHTGGAGRIIGDTLLELLHYTETHFRREERMLEEHGFPGLGAHRAEHQRMTKRLAEFERMYSEEDVALSQDVLRFLQNWFKHHILGLDQEYVEFMRQRGAEDQG